MQMQPIEGITPGELWTFLSVLVALAGIVVLLDKVGDVWRKHKARKEGNSLTVTEHLRSIDTKLDSDKRRIEALEKRQDSHDEGFRALCQATLAILRAIPHNGNESEVNQAEKNLQDYLIRR